MDLASTVDLGLAAHAIIVPSKYMQDAHANSLAFILQVDCWHHPCMRHTGVGYGVGEGGFLHEVGQEYDTQGVRAPSQSVSHYISLRWPPSLSVDIWEAVC